MRPTAEPRERDWAAPRPNHVLRIEGIDMCMMSFIEWLAMRQEGLWLPDSNALPGLSKIVPLPVKQAKLKEKLPKPVKPLAPFKAKAPKPSKPPQAACLAPKKPKKLPRPQVP